MTDLHDPATEPHSDDDWSTLFGGLPVGAFRTSLDGRFVRVNRALAQMHGFENEAEMVGAVKDLASDWFVQPGRRQEIMSLLDREGAARGLVSEIYHQSTRERMWISENAYVIRDVGGRIVFYEGTLEEVTETVHTRQALERREALLRDVTSGVPGMVFRMQVTAGGRPHYEFVGDGVRALYGVEPQAVLADPALLGRMRHPDDEARVRAAMQQHVANPASETIDFRILLASGEEKWVRLNSASHRSDSNVVALYGVVVDITAEKRAEQALHDSDERWRTALATLGEGVWDWNLVSGQCDISGPLRAAFALPSNDPALPMPSLDTLVHPDDRSSHAMARQAHADGLTPLYVHEFRLRRRDGGWLWVLTRGVVVRRDADGRATRMIGTHTDITERREAEVLRQQRDRAEAADRAKSELMSRISHELRTPLNAILGFAQLMDLDAEPGSVQKLRSAHVLQAGRLLLGLVDDVLDLTTGQSMHFSLDVRPVPLLEAFDASWAILSAQAAEARVPLLPVSVDPALVVLADPKRLRQILTNLLSNAIKYNRPGGHVAFNAQAQAGKAVFSIEDTGQGIAEKFLVRAFQPFDRLGATHGRVSGTGLGLTLCKQLVEAMGGSITVASELSVGSCFTVRLPLVDAAAGPASQP